MICFSSPNASRLRDIDKPALYMPLWSLDELLVARFELGLPFTEGDDDINLLGTVLDHDTCSSPEHFTELSLTSLSTHLDKLRQADVHAR